LNRPPPAARRPAWQDPRVPDANLDAIIAQAAIDRDRLDSKALGPFSLTALGVASVVGAGIFASVGIASAQYAGPAVVISFAIAGVAALVTAMCYAELAAMIPAAGSTYSYAYAVFGIFMAWFIGWDLLLEYLFAASTVAVSWSGYVDALLRSGGIHLPDALVNPPFGSDAGIVNVPAILIVLLTCGLLLLGMRESARSNNVMVALKLLALILFVSVGAFFITRTNWKPFIPSNTGDFGDFGVSGVVRGAGVVFFAYIGFDAVSTAAAEARNPKKTIPIGLIATVLIATTLYIAIGIVMTGMAPYQRLNVADPLAVAVDIASNNLGWLETLIDLAAVIGLAATTLVTFYGQTRIFMRMSSDGMLPDRLGRISLTRKTPIMATLVCAVGGALVAGFTPITTLGNLVSIGTLLSFTIVCAAVLVLRRRRPDLERPFRVPAVWFMAPLGIFCAVGLIATLPISTWIRLVVWLLIGLCIYFAYAKPRSTARMAGIAAAAEASGAGAGAGDGGP
jgi:basic amino acid/polyamine antiporter, APA family